MKKFIFDMLTAGNTTSSKRTWGSILFLLYIAFILAAFFVNLKSYQVHLIDGLLWGGLTLFGATLFERKV